MNGLAIETTSLGKGEVLSSILSGSTTLLPMFPRAFVALAPERHLPKVQNGAATRSSRGTRLTRAVRVTFAIRNGGL